MGNERCGRMQAVRPRKPSFRVTKVRFGRKRRDDSLTHLNHQRIMDDETETRPESVRECYSSQIYKAIKVRDEREILSLKLQIN